MTFSDAVEASAPAYYERAFRSLLWRVRARHLQRGVDRLQTQAKARIDAGESPMAAYQSIYTNARQRVIAQLARGRESRRQLRAGSKDRAATRLEHTLRIFAAHVPELPLAESADFHCDSGLGGLARWLRAAGYDARFWPHIADDELLQLTRQSCAILLTTDGPFMKRAIVQWGGVPSLLAPLQAGKQGQFEYVVERLKLPRKAARCMSCGGDLLPVAKEQVRERIPPRTYLWRDDYFLCRRCGQLFWHGTHWQRLDHTLARIVGTVVDNGAN